MFWPFQIHSFLQKLGRPFVIQSRSYAPKKAGGRQKVPKIELVPVIPAEKLQPGDAIAGINIFSDKKDPIVKEKSEYPAWLWELYAKPKRRFDKLTLIAEMTNGTGDKDFMKKYPPHWEFTTLDNVQILDKNAKRAYTRRVMRMHGRHFTDQRKAGVFKKNRS